jgi:hypothetical protein
MRLILVGALAIVAFAATMTAEPREPMLSCAPLAFIGPVVPDTEVLWSLDGL